MNEEFGSATIAGAMAVKKDSPIRSAQDLRGEKIVFGERRAGRNAGSGAPILFDVMVAGSS